MASKNKTLNKFIAREPEQKKADDLENASSPMTKERAEALFTASMKSGEIGQLQLVKGEFHLDPDNPELIAAIEFLGDTDYFFQEILKHELRLGNITQDDLDQIGNYEDFEN